MWLIEIVKAEGLVGVCVFADTLLVRPVLLDVTGLSGPLTFPSTFFEVCFGPLFLSTSVFLMY